MITGMETGMELIARLMEVSARTAPKTAGKDFIATRVVTGDELKQLGQAMADYGAQSGKHNFDRDGVCVCRSQALLLVSLNAPNTSGLNCGACGASRCSELDDGTVEGPEFRGPWCAWRLVDLGIALGSAVKTASLLNADNRIMYRVGVVARRLGLIEGEVVVGIPLSASGKNIFFDR